MKKESLITGILYMLASATSLSFVGLFGQLGLRSLSLESILFWRFLCSFCFSWILLRCVVKQKGQLKPNLILKNILRALFVLGSQYSFFFYIESNSLLNGTALLNTGPLFIPLIGLFFLRQRIDSPTWIGLTVCFIGVLCILQPESSLFSYSSWIGLLAGLCQAISQTLFGVYAKEEHPILNACYLFFFCTICSLVPYLFLEDNWIPKEGFFLMDFFLLLFLGLVSVANQLFRAAAYRLSAPSKLAAFLYFSVLFSGFLDWGILGKNFNFLSLLGAFLIVTGGSLKTLLLFKKISR